MLAYAHKPSPKIGFANFSGTGVSSSGGGSCRSARRPFPSACAAPSRYPQPRHRIRFRL